KRERTSSHPWIFRKMVALPRRALARGALVEVRSKSGAFVGRGIFHPGQTICIRLLTAIPEETVDEDFFFRRLAAAKALREEVLRLPARTDSYRLAHAEADGLSGLVIDKFANLLVVQPQCAGYLHLAEPIAGALRRLYPQARVAFRIDKRVEEREGVALAPLAARFPCPSAVTIAEDGRRMRVDFATGHKTGYFLDQRDHRAEIASLAKDREVLDLCCYTGGFAIAAMRGGARSGTAVDLDEKALALARKNASLNEVAVEFIHADAFDLLRDWLGRGRQADLVVLDPPKLAAVKDEVPRAMRAYGDLNRLALSALRPGGILLTCCCSGLIPAETFVRLVRRAAEEAGVALQIFREAGAAPDHPVRSDFPEGRYFTAIYGRSLPLR
ncbi:MAG: class I SAM-dependent rRNA methyltransferase, partial [Planctomycetota bacterium]|nr:class I SAM-dependent rRNA methyltransferase [Planctomycetota bacterium]